MKNIFRLRQRISSNYLCTASSSEKLGSSVGKSSKDLDLRRSRFLTKSLESTVANVRKLRLGISPSSAAVTGVDSGATIQETSVLMMNRKLSSVFTVNKDYDILGLLTHRDVLYNMKEDNEEEKLISEVMTPVEKLVMANSSETIVSALKKMKRARVNHLPIHRMAQNKERINLVDLEVVTSAKRLIWELYISLLSSTEDIAKTEQALYITDLEQNLSKAFKLPTVEDVISRKVQVIANTDITEDDVTLAQVIEHMRIKHIDYVGLVKNKGLQSIITDRDILRIMSHSNIDATSTLIEEPFEILHQRHVHKVKADTSLLAAIRMMCAFNEEHYAVVANSGEIIGIVTPYDIAEALVDAEISVS